MFTSRCSIHKDYINDVLLFTQQINFKHIGWSTWITRLFWEKFQPTTSSFFVSINSSHLTFRSITINLAIMLLLVSLLLVHLCLAPNGIALQHFFWFCILPSIFPPLSNTRARYFGYRFARYELYHGRGQGVGSKRGQLPPAPREIILENYLLDFNTI